MSGSSTMREVASLIKQFDEELRQGLKLGRSGVFRKANGELYVRTNVPLGQKYPEEVLGIFADESDLDFYFRTYLEE